MDILEKCARKIEDKLFLIAKFATERLHRVKCYLKKIQSPREGIPYKINGDVHRLATRNPNPVLANKIIGCYLPVFPES